jgi:membrane protein YqaA with SNARE-associated domain
VEQQLLALPEHLDSLSVFSGVRVARSLVLCVCFVIVVCNFVLFLLAIVLSVLLRYTVLIAPLVSSNSSLSIQ